MPSTLKIASWNINSVRARIGIVEQFLTAEQPAVALRVGTQQRVSQAGQITG